MYLESVGVDGFWSDMSVDLPLHPGVNVIIGINGSGKTTLINLINAVLTADVGALENFPFSAVRIRLGAQGKRHTRLLSVTKEVSPDDSSSYVTYRLGASKLGQFTLGVARYRTRLKGGRMVYRNPRSEQLEALQARLSDVVNVRWLSVHRYAAPDAEQESMPEMTSPVDAKLQALRLPLTRYLLGLEESAHEATTEFHRQVVLTMLYDPEIDSFGMSDDKLAGIDLGAQESALRKVLDELDIPSTTARPRVSEHMAALKKSMDAFRDFLHSKERKGLTIDDILPLPLLNRTERIVQLVKEIEDKKREIFRKREQFRELANGFFTGKQVSFKKGGELQVHLAGGRSELGIEQLSSGEKQLLIQMIEVLLQQENPCVFIADEPELSLHVEWQEKLLASLAELNPNAQIIVATHSPEIVGDFSDRVVDMVDIVHG